MLISSYYVACQGFASKIKRIQLSLCKMSI